VSQFNTVIDGVMHNDWYY